MRCVLKRFTAITVISLALLLSKPYGNAQSSKTSATPEHNDILKQYDDSLDALAEKVLPAVVQIEVSGFGARETKGGGDDDVGVIERQRAIGSGVIVDPDGYIMTNAHVVNGAQRIRVIITPTPAELVAFKSSFSNRQRTYEAKLLGINRLVDLALIKIDAKDLPYIPLRLDFRVRLGQVVLAVGSPEGLEHTVTRGIVSAVGRQIDPTALWCTSKLMLPLTRAIAAERSSIATAIWLRLIHSFTPKAAAVAGIRICHSRARSPFRVSRIP